MRQTGRRQLLGLLVATALLLSASVALALDKDDILRLHEAGLDSGTIVNVIRGTTEDLEVTAADVDELEAAGVPSAVISELRLRLGVQETTPPGGTDLQQELLEEQRLEQERLRLEQERREAEREALRLEMEQDAQREESVDTAFQGLRRARQLYQAGDYLAAAAVYNRFLEEIMPTPGTQEWYQAKLGFIRSMHAAGLRSAIRADTLEVALMGSDWAGFSDAIQILRDVVSESGFASPRIADLSNEVVAEMDPAFQDEFNYFMGRYYYNSGSFSLALSHLANVSVSGDYAARAAFLTGVVSVNPEVEENLRGVAAFQDAIRRATPDNEVDRAVAENAFLALARIAYQVGNFGGAAYYYNKIDPASERATTALFEGAWNYFLQGDTNRALGAFHSLHSPYHNHRFFPDLYVLEAAAYLYTCHIDEAHEAVAQFEEIITPLRDEVTTLLSEVSDPSIFYLAIMDPVANREAGNPTLHERLRAVVLADADFFSLYRVIQQLEDERAAFRAVSDTFGERGETTLSSLEVEISNKQVEAGLLVRDIIYNFGIELDDWWFKAQEVEIEITDLEARYLESILSGSGAEFTEGTTLFVVPDDWQFWPWEGEYWFDEVGNYRGNLSTRCPDDVVF